MPISQIVLVDPRHPDDVRPIAEFPEGKESYAADTLRLLRDLPPSDPLHPASGFEYRLIRKGEATKDDLASLFVLAVLDLNGRRFAVERSHDCPFRFPESSKGREAIRSLRLDRHHRLYCNCQRCLEIGAGAAEDFLYTKTGGDFDLAKA